LFHLRFLNAGVGKPKDGRRVSQKIRPPGHAFDKAYLYAGEAYRQGNARQARPGTRVGKPRALTRRDICGKRGLIREKPRDAAERGKGIQYVFYHKFFPSRRFDKAAGRVKQLNFVDVSVKQNGRRVKARFEQAGYDRIGATEGQKSFG
jgi:hypothetical protein